ncbi:MAG: hypothetical protein WBM61_03910 [Woeseiaceae bacterium]|jgi:hypothetical protein
MDKLANRLRQDADSIEVAVSDELDHRIAASLRSVTPQQESESIVTSRRPALFWWASSLTGIAAAAAVIILVNSGTSQVPATATPSTTVTATPASIAAAVPAIDWQAETAMLTSQLQQELDALQSDIKKAEEKVKDDIGL